MLQRIDETVLKEKIAALITFSLDKANKRNFNETIDLQIGLKGIDPKKTRRFSESIRLPYCPRPNLKICVVGNDVHCAEAQALGIDSLTAVDCAGWNRDKKIIKKVLKKYDGFLASQAFMAKINRWFTPMISKAGKFPLFIASGSSVEEKADELRSQLKLQLKKVVCLGAAIGHLEMPQDEILSNTTLAINLLISCLPRGWQNVKSLYLHTTMGKEPQRIY